ncbi:sugar ABC transporter permease [Pseudarthrobacter enclensis]|jgi:multiple sugar transport system permease protein/raffinose/stachyose/melibiose transport system permease protein|uniref:ABC transporter permease n=1 Tax=Pseudarthrobacter enclensis TaxID=993070 RepID=A0A0V8IUP8_9MICC|nr:sugar ABC transporter permease [Pseudarthrobacter enclensis]KSU78515.1 ABC transporter permease [Pseudarthrobacter enclensis]BCW20398.1 ABC transporter permease [Arthrobacter sp. NtRootA9]SCB72359.1 carbohydrate ABC transporter membrane protein 1, CUT1 family [Pseudarthrobacter enclensis]
MSSTTQELIPPEAREPGGGRPGRRTGGRVRRLTGRDKLVLSLMVGIPTLIELALVWLPTLMSVGLSFTRWNGLDLADIRPAGTENYQYITQDYPPFWPAVQHNLLWLLFLALIATPLGLLLAVLLDQNIRGSKIYQSIFFAPVMLSLALIGIIWQLFYQRDNGLLNFLLGTAGTPQAVDWFGDSSVNIWAAMIAATWRHAGYVMLLYLAGLKGVDPSLREAAAIDGANAVQTFFRVVFPAMRPINIVIVVITIIESLRAFDVVYVINRGTNGLEMLSALVIQNLVGEGQVIGVGSALAVVLLVISLVPIVFYLSRTFGKENRA